MPNSSSLKRQTEAKGPKAKLHRCNEPRCGARYARTGDLARHKREKHSGEEYLCPYSQCLKHRKGGGFKRQHRLVQHLLNSSYFHPQALSQLDAQYIAVDYNETRSSCDFLEVDTDDRRNGVGWVRLINGRGNDLDDLAEYRTRLVGTHCPEPGCPCFVIHSRDSMFDLQWHLQRDHPMEWEETRRVTIKLTQEHWPEANEAAW
jgi:hypothetical protein